MPSESNLNRDFRARMRFLGLGFAFLLLGVFVLGARVRAAAEVGAETLGPLSEVRRLSFAYSVTIPGNPIRSPNSAAESEADAGEMTVFLPIASDATGQRVLKFSVDSDFPGQVEVEATEGNRFWRADLPVRRDQETTITVHYEIDRSVVRSGDDPGSKRAAAKYLGANQRVAVAHPVLEPILKEIRAQSPGADQAVRARAIYDWVVDNVEYKKVGTGWGNGDTFWACNERYGNCTDFHSLFISLARTEKIPARFEMGFPIPLDRKEGQINGYHCWVEFWLPEAGWVPIDASEAFKNPERRELFYGTHPADRIQFSRGRDLRLGEKHAGRPLNYFIYPYFEIQGKRVDLDVEMRFTYRDREGAESLASAD